VSAIRAKSSQSVSNAVRQEPESEGATAHPALASLTTRIPYTDAEPLFTLLRPELLPPELRDQTEKKRRQNWPRWVARRDAEIRDRLLPGYEDSIVNLLFFGTRFTTAPRIKYADIPDLEKTFGRNAVLQKRLDDMVAALASPGTNGRLRFVRNIVEQRAFAPSTRTGRDRVQTYL
jgi:hypothetical protein